MSPDGKTLVSGSKEGALKLWNAAPKSRPLAEHPLPSDLIPFEGRALSPDGTKLLVTYSNATWNVLDTRSSAATTRRPLPFDAVKNLSAVALSAEGRFCAFASVDGVAKVIESESGRMIDQLSVWSGEEKGLALGLVFAPHDNRLAAGGTNNTLIIRDVVKHETVVLRDDWQWTWPMAFSPDGTLLVSLASPGLRTKVWNLAQRSAIGVFSGHRLNPSAAAFSADGRWLATAGPDGIACVYEIAHPSKPPVILRGDLQGILSVAFFPNGRRLATGDGQAARVQIWDMETFRELATLRGHRTSVSALAALDEDTLVSVSGEAVHIWRASPLKEIDAKLSEQNLK